MKTYFVTGATGAIGSALIPILLRDAQTRVRLLLRAPSDEALGARLEELFRFWQIDAADGATRRRVTALRGDATEPRFALDEDAYRALGEACTHIVHAAGNVRMNLPLSEARHCSVDSARHIVALARTAPRLEKIEFVSTVGVGGRSPGVVAEDWLSTPRAFHNTYEEAKAEAEVVIREAADGGLPLTVHRPSMVVGDTVSGRIIHFQIFYHLCEFLSGRRTAGLSPTLGAARLDIVPADYVAALIAWSSTSAATVGRVLHACSGPQGALALEALRGEVRRAFAGAGRSLPPVIRLPNAVFMKLLRLAAVFMAKPARRAIATLPVFLDYLSTEQGFANASTQRLLAPHGLALPPPEAYLGKVLAYYLAQGVKP